MVRFLIKIIRNSPLFCKAMNLTSFNTKMQTKTGVITFK